MKLKAKNVICALALSGLLGWAFAAEAGTTTFHGVTVDYGNATANGVGEDLVLTYKGSSDSLDFGNALVNADILLVGGGGSGSSGGSSTTSGYGGVGGQVVEEPGVLLSGKSTIAVGGGGAAVKAAGRSRTSGKVGNKTSISGAIDLAAEGGSCRWW